MRISIIGADAHLDLGEDAAILRNRSSRIALRSFSAVTPANAGAQR